MAKWRVEVGYKAGQADAIGDAVKADIGEDLRISGIEAVSYIDVYEINASGLELADVKRIAERLFTDPITQEYSINAQLSRKFDWAIEVRYHTDVTDNVGITALEGIADITGKKFSESESVRSARRYLIRGKITKEQAEGICRKMLANDLIENYSIEKGGK